MSPYDILIVIYWVPHCGNFRIETEVVLDMMITYAELILCHGTTMENNYK